MPRPSQEKCRLCSKLSAVQAQERHGAEGDGCWDSNRCHDRRSYYRHRSIKNYNRKARRQTEQEQGLQQTEDDGGSPGGVTTIKIRRCCRDVDWD